MVEGQVGKEPDTSIFAITLSRITYSEGIAESNIVQRLWWWAISLRSPSKVRTSSDSAHRSWASTWSSGFFLHVSFGVFLWIRDPFRQDLFFLFYFTLDLFVSAHKLWALDYDRSVLWENSDTGFILPVRLPVSNNHPVPRSQLLPGSRRGHDEA